MNDISLFLTALKFSAYKHRNQRRKNRITPYINHPIEVAEMLWKIGKVRDMDLIIAALLHDVLEDTETMPAEIEELCGKHILSIVQEVTDDKNLSKQQRKKLQIETAAHKSILAKQLKLADKICNVHDIIHSPPHDWSMKRCQEYIVWTEQVINELRGVNSDLENHYDVVLAKAKVALN
ncbi:MAG: bifunctional (p)ppGpp synthetase/guanosine-3',5'-bis(diphosphate) 3'-pyrophosphohydrolase [Thiomargarita sp.]|nr:bifunctional (p)ppGpp synthetase/guanosine-3',5'-bis(diphosphate) 3'-pyrophosphohydrolase [Thiomargarita sp.]